MKRHLLQQTIILTLLTGIISLTGACAFSNEDQAVVCDPAVEGSCIVSYDEPDKNLAQDFAAYETAYLPDAGTITLDTPPLVQSTTDTSAPQVIAVSEPVETTGISVQEKQAQQQLAVLQGEIDAQASAQAQQMAQTEAEALNQVMTHVAANTVYYDPTTGQPVADYASTQPGVVVGGNDLEGKIVVSKKKQKKKVAPQKKTIPLEQRVLFGEDVQDWNAPAGESLRSLLMKWGEQSGWTVIWKLDRDYTLEAGVVFRGTFIEAASAFIRSFARATPAPIGTFYKGNRVLLIDTQENDNAN